MTREELIEKTDQAISELVYDKHELQKAYNYYNGKRDPEQFRYLEENFGLGSPTAVEFTPLLKKHVDALVGEYLGTPILPKVSCKDSDTISNITREKQLQITKGVVGFLKEHLQNSILQFIDGKDITDKSIKRQLDKIIQDIDQSFISQYEIAAQNVINYVMQSRETDLITKLRYLLTDLLITGYTFFRVKPSITNTNIEIEVLNPLNTFIDRNPESPYVRNSYRAVVRYWLTKNQILAKYGNELSKKDLSELKNRWYDEGTPTYRRTLNSIDSVSESYTLPGYPDNEYNSSNFQLFPVYDVEWLETDKNFVMQRYNTIRIGDSIYILRGKDENVIRSKDNPNFCGLTVNGVYFLNRGYQPYSLILKCAHLQDRYDLLHYYRDVLIANSGTAGVIMDQALLPTNLGVKWPERVQKWLAYKKSGIMWVDSTQEGRNETGSSPLNTIFNGFDDTLKAQAVQAIELAIQSVEETTSSITGVFRERLNGIEQRDAVTNIKQGVANSFIVTKHYFQQMDLITSELLLDSLNQAKIVYKNGLTGTLILGDKYQKVFTALPEHFTITDHDVHIVASTEIMQDLQLLKQMIPDFVKSQALAPDIIFEAMTSKSLSDLKLKVQKAMQIQKEENNQIQQLSQQLEQANQQLQQVQAELQKSQNKIQQMDEKRFQLEQEKMKLDYQVNLLKANTDKAYKEDQIRMDEKRIQMEVAQLYDGNPYNDAIKNI